MPSTTFNSIKLCDSFSQLPHSRGYGIIIESNIDSVNAKIKKINWKNYLFKSTNGANNLRTQLIIDAVEKQMNDYSPFKKKDVIIKTKG